MGTLVNLAGRRSDTAILVGSFIGLLEDMLDIAALPSTAHLRLKYLLRQMNEAAGRGHYSHIATLLDQAALAVERAQASAAILGPGDSP